MKRKMILSTLLTVLIASSVSSVAYAKVTDAIVQDNAQKFYKYNYDALSDSLMGDGVLYDSFIARINAGGKVYAYLDDKVGFVRADDVAEAVGMGGDDFQTFISNAKPSNIITVSGDIKKTVVKGDQAVDEEESTNNVTLAVDSSTLLGFTFLKISYDGMKSTDTVTYDGQPATWSAKWNCFAVKFNGTHEVSEYSADKVKITNITLSVDSTSLLGYTFLKINFDGADPDKYTVTYDGQEVAWSTKFNCFAIKFEGTKSVSDFSTNKVSITSKTSDGSDFDVVSID